MADGLSHLPKQDARPSDIDLDELLTSAYFGASQIILNPDFEKRIKKAYSQDSRTKAIIDILKQSNSDPLPYKILYQLSDDLLYLNKDSDESWLVIPRPLTTEVFRMIHDLEGHQGYETGIQKMQGLAVYKGAKLLKDYINACLSCQFNRARNHKPYGQLQPITSEPVPYHTITMDFMIGLPVTKTGFDQILVVVDKFTKQIGLVPGSTSWKAENWGETLLSFFQTADWGIPIKVISDRDAKFTSKLWKGLFRTLGV